MTFDENKLQALLEKAVVDFGATFHASLVVLGDKLGLYKTLAETGPITPEAFAERTGTAERYVREWLSAQAAGGYVTYDPASGRFSLSPEQAIMLADETSPAFVPGAFQVATSAARIEPRLEQAFRTGAGIGWHEHEEGLFHGTERFFRPNYAAHLVSEWIPALDGVEDTLRAGGTVADVGCGHGASTILMAKAFPESTFTGFDYHEASIRQARERAKAAGVSDRVTFEVAAAKTFDGGAYDLVTVFDCLHDMGDPVGAASHVRSKLREAGTWMIVEPYAGDRLEDNLNPVGRAFYSVSTLVCTPCSLDQDGGHALGSQAGEARIRDVVDSGGFGRFRRVAETPFNLVFEAKP